MKKLVVVGGNAAGMSAASQVKRLKPDWEVIVFEKTNHISYAACGMPYYLEGMVENIEDLVELSPKEAIEKRKIDLRLQHKVIKIDPQGKMVVVEGPKGKEEESFDYLVISTGSLPETAGLKYEKSDRIFTFKWLEDAQAIDIFIKEHKPRKAAVIGGGYIGLEMVEALKERGLETHLVHRREDLARAFEREVSDLLKEKMKSEGVILNLNTSIKNIRTVGKKVVIDTQGGSLEYDLVLLGLGAFPDTALAKEAGIELGVKGSIKVNRYLQTNYDYIYAAGDCVEAINMVSGKPVYAPLAPKANKEGMMAGMNIAGEKAEFQGVWGTSVVKLFDIAVARTGLTMEEAAEKFNPVKINLTSRTRAKYYPGSTEMFSLLIADKGSGRLLGAQLVGPVDAVKRIDVYATALYNKMTLQDIFNLDLAYAPPFSPVYDPILLAARIGRKKV